MEKLRQWFNKQMNMKIFVGGVFAMIVFYLLQLLTTSIYDSDMYFLIATGREILDNGIPYHNVWTIDSNLSIIVQQWLYDVIIAVVDKAGPIGFTIFCSAQFCLLIFLITRFLAYRNLKFGINCLIIGVTIMFSQFYIFSLRPELITLIILLTECLILEKFRENYKWQWLIGLPLLMLIEINIHASMWPIHYAILLAYIIPSFYIPKTKKDSIYVVWRPLSIFTLLMTGIMFLNPYGLDGILYIVKSFMASTFQYVKIVEVVAPGIISPCGCSIIIGFVLLFLCFYLNVLHSTSANIAIGFGFLAATAGRHNMFSLFILLFLLRDLGSYLDTLDLDWKKDVKNYLYPLLIMGNIFFIGLFYGTITSMFVISDNSVGYQLESISDYMKENGYDDTHIFTGFNCGAYFEYEGFKNVYIDARPEIYTAEFTGDKNILRDYSRYCLYGYSTVTETEADMLLLSQNEMDNWFNSYDFDYIVITVKSEMNLAAYMRTNDKYDLVESLTGPTYAFYEKK